MGPADNRGIFDSPSKRRPSIDEEDIQVRKSIELMNQSLENFEEIEHQLQKNDDLLDRLDEEPVR